MKWVAPQEIMNTPNATKAQRKGIRRPVLRIMWIRVPEIAT